MITDQLKSELANLQSQSEQIIGQLNFVLGKIDALKGVIALLETPTPVEATPEKQ